MTVPEQANIHPALHHVSEPLIDASKEIEIQRKGTEVSFEGTLTRSGEHCLAVYATVSIESHAEKIFY